MSDTTKKELPKIKIEDTLGKCKIKKILGQGGMGTVYLGEHEQFNIDVAIKVLHKINPQEVNNFIKEAQSIAKLEHPNIMQIYDIENDKDLGVYYLITQFIQGKTLEDILKEKGKIELQEAIDIIINTSKALEYAHKKGLIHRDVKPANIMKSDDGSVKLTDFGLAQNLEESSEKGITISGTPNYIAPEQCMGEQMDERTDIYSLGATFYHLISGTPPFHGNYTIKQLLELHINESPPFLSNIKPEIPEEISKFIKKMLSKSKEERPKNCTEIIEFLESYLESTEKSICPICNKPNITKETFTCQKCGQENLCLKHLIPGKQLCSKCFRKTKAKATQRIINVIEHNRIKLQETIKDICIHPTNGIIVISSKKKFLVIHIEEEKLSIAFPSLTKEELIELYEVREEYLEQEELKIKLIRKVLVDALLWKKLNFEFYDKKDPSFLSKDYFSVELEINPIKFLKLFTKIIQLSISLSTSGGLIIKSTDFSLSVLFYEKGISILRSSPLENQENKPIIKKDEACAYIKKIINERGNSITFYGSSLFPDIKGKLYESPFNNLRTILNEDINWEKVATFIPVTEDFLPHTTNWDSPFGNIPLDELHKHILNNLHQKLFDFSTHSDSLGIDEFNFLLILLALAKETIFNVSKRLSQTAKYYQKDLGDVASQKTLETAILLSNYDIDTLELLKKISEDKKVLLLYNQTLGYINYIKRDFKKSLEYYNKALEIDKYSLQVKLELMKTYKAIKDWENFKKIGLDIIPNLKKKGNSKKKELEKICKELLKIDNNLYYCHRELVSIYLAREEKSKAIEQYKILAEIHKKTGNEKELEKTYQKILKIDPELKEIKKELTKLKSFSLLKTMPKNWIYAAIILMAIILALVTIREWNGWNKISLIETQMKLGDLETAEKNIEELESKFFFSNLKGKLQKEKIKLANGLKKRDKKQTLLIDKRLLRKFLANVKSLAKQNDWKSAIELCQEELKKCKTKEIKESFKLKLKDLEIEFQKYKNLFFETKFKNALRLLSTEGLESEGIKILKELSKTEEPWKSKAQNTLKKIHEADKKFKNKNEQDVKIVKDLYLKALNLEKNGNYKESLNLLFKIRQIKDSTLAEKVAKLKAKIKSIRKKAKSIISEAEKYEIQGNYEEAISKYEEVLNDKKLSCTTTADLIQFPLLIKSYPVNANCYIGENKKLLGETPIVYRYPPKKFPKIFIERKGFGESAKSSIQTKSGKTWQVTVKLNIVPDWSSKVNGKIIFPLIFQNDKIFFATEKGVIHSLNSTGKSNWKYTLGYKQKIIKSIAIDKNNIYTGTMDGKLHCINTKTEDAIWKFDAKAPIDCTPYILDKKSYFVTTKGYLHMLDDSGQEIWNHKLSFGKNSSVTGFGKVIFCRNFNYLYAIMPSMKRIWWVKTFPEEIIAGPKLSYHNVPSKKRLYIIMQKGKITCLNLFKKVFWQRDYKTQFSKYFKIYKDYIYIKDNFGKLHCINAANGNKKWSFNLPELWINFLDISDNNIFISTPKGNIYKISAKTGKILYKIPTWIKFSGNVQIHDKSVIMSSKDGFLYSFWLD